MAHRVEMFGNLEPPAGAGAEWPRPRVLVSACLGFAHVRYDGSRISHPVIAALEPYVEFLPVCPEVAIGLGVPRPPVRLVATREGLRLLQPHTGRDLTDAMVRFGESFLSQLGGVDGVILKSRSPSCGLRDAPVHGASNAGGAHGPRAGLFVEILRRSLPDVPAEDEGRLLHREIREHFLTAIFALARLRQAAAIGTRRALIEFHAQHKLLLMAYHQGVLRDLGRLVASAHRLPIGEAFQRYSAAFRAALAHPPRRSAVVNAMLHALGYVSDRLTPQEKAHFLQLLERYRHGQLSIHTPLGLLQSWILRFEEPYLSRQAFFRPFPEALLLAEDTGRGRPLRR